jgi:hypothetical protein
MRILIRSIVLICLFFAGLASSGLSQNLSPELRRKVDVVVESAYREASALFPCKMKARGQAKMVGWQDVAKCLNKAHDLVEWEELSQQIQKIQESGRYHKNDVASAVEASLSSQAISYDKVFTVKQPKALLPLSSSLLKFLPADSFLNFPVYDKKGIKIGTFSGTYFFERRGGLMASTDYQMTIFQYTDLNGQMQSPAERLLLDSYGVPWKDAQSRPGFRLPLDKLIPKR